MSEFLWLYSIRRHGLFTSEVGRLTIDLTLKHSFPTASDNVYRFCIKHELRICLYKINKVNMTHFPYIVKSPPSMALNRPCGKTAHSEISRRGFTQVSCLGHCLFFDQYHLCCRQLCSVEVKFCFICIHLKSITFSMKIQSMN